MDILYQKSFDEEFKIRAKIVMAIISKTTTSISAKELFRLFSYSHINSGEVRIVIKTVNNIVIAIAFAAIRPEITITTASNLTSELYTTLSNFYFYVINAFF